MTEPKKPPSQHARFLETARALGCDEDEAAYDDKLKAVLESEHSTDPVLLNALAAGLQTGKAYAERSKKDVSDSKGAISKAEKALKR